MEICEADAFHRRIVICTGERDHALFSGVGIDDQALERPACSEPTRFALGMKIAVFDASMPDAQLDQLLHAPTWKALPVVILRGCGGIALRELLHRFGQRSTRFAHSIRDSRILSAVAIKRPHCPSCDRKMVKRTVRRGSRRGVEFWGCSNYPICSDTRSA